MQDAQINAMQEEFQAASEQQRYEYDEMAMKYNAAVIPETEEEYKRVYGQGFVMMRPQA